MWRRTCPLLRLNKSTGHRWSAIPKPPPAHTDRLYGIHTVLNALRVFASNQSSCGSRALVDSPDHLPAVSTVCGADHGGGRHGIAAADELLHPVSAQALAAAVCGRNPVRLSKTEAAERAEGLSGEPCRHQLAHPHRAFIKCLYIRDFSAEDEPTPSSASRATANGKGRGQVEDSSPASQHSKSSREGRQRKMIPARYSALHRVAALAKDVGVPIRFVPRRELWQLCGDRRNQNVVLEVGRYVPTKVPDASAVLQSLLTASRTRAGCERGPVREASVPSDGSALPAESTGTEDVLVVLYLDHIIDPANIGSILRTSFFFGVDHVILSSTCASCTAAVARASTGFLEYMNVMQSTQPTPVFLTRTKEAFDAMVGHSTQGTGEEDVEFVLEIIGSTAHRPQRVPHVCVDQSLPATEAAAYGAEPVKVRTRRRSVKRVCLVVLGNEDAGLSEEVIQCCSHLLHIRSPRHERLDAAKASEDEKLHRSLSSPSPSSAAAEDKEKLTELEKRARAARKLRRLHRSEVSLNVNTACAALLAHLVGTGHEATSAPRSSSLVQIVAKVDGATVPRR